MVIKRKQTVRSGIFLGVVSCLLAASVHAQSAQKYFLVKDGKTQSVIVAPKNPPVEMQNAIDELQYHLKRASGVTLKVTDEKEAKSLPTDWVRITFKQDKNLPEETFQIQTKDNILTFIGDGADRSDAAHMTSTNFQNTNETLQWAVDHFLDKEMGVRWLWPGDVGTYVPERKDIPLSELNVSQRPYLELRNLRIGLEGAHKGKSPVKLLNEQQYQRQLDEARGWLRRFQIGARSEYKFGHSFTKWWGKYSKDHPDYFAVPPEGSKMSQPYPREGWVKLNLSNTKVDDQIIAEWKAAGAPDNWNVCPNDGSGFDASPATLAMDIPANPDPQAAWGGKANLTARYVKFWNRLIPKMREINPNVSLSSYAYSAYRQAPPSELKLEPNIVLGFVPSFDDDARENWKGWQEAGAKLFLRPNWWHMARVSPNLPLYKQGNFVKFAMEHNMVGFDSDSLMGDWGVQSPLYYTIARLITQPEMSVDDAINEYSSAFGNAAPQMKEYLLYWNDFAEKVGFQYTYPEPGGLLDKVVKKHHLRRSYLNQSWEVMPYLYTDDVLAKGYAILDKADRAAKADNKYVKERIQFLRDGLTHLKMTRDVSELGKSLTRTVNNPPEEVERYKEMSKSLQAMRKEMTLRHVIWGESLYASEQTRKAPTIVDKILDEISPLQEFLAKNYQKNDSSPLEKNWLFHTDPENNGEAQGFIKKDYNDGSWSPISPMVQWQLQEFADYYGVGWYRLSFQGKKLKKGEEALLYFAGVDGNAVVYVNGTKVAEHQLGENYKGWDEPFTADITKLMNSGKNVLVVKVTSKDKSTASGIFKGVSLLTGIRK